MNSKILALDSELNRIRLPSESKFLDVGCADGDVTIFIADKLGIKWVYGVDIDEEALKKAKERIIAFKVDVSKEKLPFPDETFNLCTLLSVIEHLENPDNALKEIHRVLKRGDIYY
jgi:ubiquinone/menaquinone biosynthesis C-methylase UbiE